MKNWKRDDKEVHVCFGKQEAPNHYGPTTYYPFHSQVWSISNFPCTLTKNIMSHSMTNLAFHSLLRLKIIYYQFYFTHTFSLQVGRMYFLNLGVQGLCGITLAPWTRWIPNLLSDNKVQNKWKSLWLSGEWHCNREVNVVHSSAAHMKSLEKRIA